MDEDGARRQEVKKTEETAHGNEEVVAEAVRKGKEIQDYIDDWEPDDELDEEALWAPVLTITAGFQKDGRFRVPAVRDKKKMNVLEAVSRLSGDGSAESLCAGGNCDFRKMDFDRGISVGIVCRRRERKAGDSWGCLDGGA